IAARLTGLLTASLLAAGAWIAFDLPVPDALRPAVTVATVVLGVAGLGLAWLALRPAWWRAVVERVASALGGEGTVGRAVARVRDGVIGVTDAAARVARAGPGAWAASVGWAAVADLVVALGVVVFVGG